MSARCALFIGHPGHELRVLGWLAEAKPLVAVLTDGSGHHGEPRLLLTRRLIHQSGASASSMYGVLSDQDMYRAILVQDMALFLGLADRFANLLIDHAIDFVAGDAIEGYNPTHDVCRLLIDRAVRIAERRNTKGIRNLLHPYDPCIKNYAFSLTPTDPSFQVPAEAWRISLTPDQLARKLEECRRYAQLAGGELPAEMEKLLQADRNAASADEVLYPMDTAAALARFEYEKPFYEVHGERRVAAGQYKDVIRFRQHIAPIAAALAVPS